MENKYSKTKLAFLALTRFIPGILLLSFVLFISAGSFGYWNAWFFMGILSIPLLIILIYLVTCDPELLEKRLNTRETEQTQKKMIIKTSITFLSVLIVSGLDYRFQWTPAPIWLVFSSAIIYLLGNAIFFIVMLQNKFASRVIEIQEKQKVIDTGLYSYVRHPMYTAVIMMFFFMPLILGSLSAFILMLIFPYQINIRIKNEEKVLEKGLEGYIAYKKRVKYKVIPFLW
ncbi:MAG: isoprenylcysteine carboxylmethyltransferase family protein [Bacteroidota bacterium]